MSLSTRPVMAPLDTISRRDSSDMVRPSGKRSSCARTSKRAIDVLNSLRRRWLRRLSILTEQPSSRSQSLSSKCPFWVAAGASSRVDTGPLARVRAREAAGLVMGSLMEVPSDDDGAETGAAADVEDLARDERRVAASEKEHGVGHVLGPSQPLHRDGCRQRRFALAAGRNDLVEHVRAVNRAGR